MIQALPISSLYVSLLAFVILSLAYAVVKQRMVSKIGLGDQGNELLSVAMRAHANAVEYIPIIALLFVLAELNGVAGWVLHIVGVITVVARVAHGYGFIKSAGKTHPGRYHGTLATWLVIVALGLTNIVYGLA